MLRPRQEKATRTLRRHKAVEAGDLVVLYSKPGTQSQKKLNNGTAVHFFYWGVGGTIGASGAGSRRSGRGRRDGGCCAGRALLVI
jgi:hypothetical protein